MEVLHNGFLKVYKNIVQYDSARAGLYTWMRSIMVHAAIDFIRTKEQIFAPLELDFVEETVENNKVMEKLDAEELLELIRQLPPATQAVFNLYVVDGFNHREISGMINISEGTSKWHLSEARRLLKQYIQIQQSHYD